MERQAAEALLQLHFGTSRSSSEKVKVEIKGAATLLLSCRSTPNVPPTAALPSPAAQRPRVCSDSSRDENTESEVYSQSSIDSPIVQKSKKLIRKSAIKYRHLEPAFTRRDVRQAQRDSKKNRTPQKNGYGSLHNPINFSQKKTCEQGTQTDNSDLLKEKDIVILKLYARIHSLEKQLKAYQRNQLTPPINELDPDVTTDVLLIQQNNQEHNNYDAKIHKRSLGPRNTIDTSVMDSDDEWSPEKHESKRQTIQATPKCKEMVPIGEGHASVPARLLKQMDWSSYTGATRKLLTAVFSRRELATHSLTGKPSPAFPGKPAKKRLDPELVNDIVQTVVERCGVPESIVRTSITTKCADESKMYRSCQQKKIKHRSRTNLTKKTFHRVGMMIMTRLMIPLNRCVLY